ncbi:hypothetical protein C6A37_04205 [Desulfobacteraceae bacterium SEEP-SAG9]|nr:hypothetical protein C6A37_04205 [Desulfobacteraceae bacterium SEEP-SAG9]
MLFVIRFTDKPDSQTIREQYLDAHVSWLDERRESVLVAGSLRDEPSSNPVGAFWVVEAKSKSEAAEIFKSDPFWTNGMREKVEIFHWSKAFPDEKALV